MSTIEPSKTSEPVPWAGTGECHIPDMRNREFLLYGTRVGDAFTIEKAFYLEGWEQKSLVDALMTGAESPLRLTELEDTTGLVPHTVFDLPKGSGVGVALLGFQHAANGFGSALERVATGQAGFHLLPRMLDRIWLEIGDGNLIRVHRYQAATGERSMVAAGDAFRKGVAVAHAVALEERLGARRQLAGTRVLHADLGVCPECGSSMIKTNSGQKMCELEHLKSQVLPPDVDVTTHPDFQEMMSAFADLEEIDESLLEPV